MVASWTHPKSGRVYSIAVIESCDAWNTFIDGEWIARDQPTFEDAVAVAEMKLTRKTWSSMIRIAGVLLLVVILGASAVVASKFMPAIPSEEISALTEGEASGEPSGASAPEDAALVRRRAEVIEDAIGVAVDPIPRHQPCHYLFR